MIHKIALEHLLKISVAHGDLTIALRAAHGLDRPLDSSELTAVTRTCANKGLIYHATSAASLRKTVLSPEDGEALIPECILAGNVAHAMLSARIAKRGLFAYEIAAMQSVAAMRPYR